MEAEFSIEYASPKIAKSIMQALSPDNITKDKGMQIKASVERNRLNVLIKGCDRVETLEATVQDVFRCMRAAETSLSETASEK
jgi:tRNA threonylcarbamoyladenosine modification (KEOPS) complex  Pcc1 subunit